MKFHSLSTHHYADGGVGDVFESTKHFLSFRVLQPNPIQFKLNFNVGAYGHWDETTGAVLTHVMFEAVFTSLYWIGLQPCLPIKL